ncbi:hypothetical protein [Actinomyces israelii]|uniref:hypothetical protein n=1 Tax=Actinomyces israelii TaxID=1659 RepID=UPI0005BAEFE5|nr:hypothetical protein [Actinomyces israelii]
MTHVTEMSERRPAGERAPRPRAGSHRPGPAPGRPGRAGARAAPSRRAQTAGAPESGGQGRQQVLAARARHELGADWRPV